MSYTSFAAKPGSQGLETNKGTYTLPNVEYVIRKDEGHCYHSGLAFGLGHHCPEKILSGNLG